MKYGQGRLNSPTVGTYVTSIGGTNVSLGNGIQKGTALV